MFDSHLHTTFSSDSTMTLSQARAQGQKLGLSLIITEHYDFRHPMLDEFLFNPEDYFASYEPWRDDHLLLGVEIGMHTDFFQEASALVRNYPFDFILGSVHYLNGQEIFECNLFQYKPKLEVYAEYFTYMLECVKTHPFVNSFAHFDFIARYAPLADPAIYYYELSDALDPVLKTIAQQNQALEINTKAWHDRDSITNLLPVYQRFKELGGKYVTIGSDAHRPDQIGHGLDLAQQLAEHCRLQIVHFRKGEPVISPK